VNDHVSRHHLERWAVDGQRAALPLEQRAHMAACDYCRMRERKLNAARERFLAEHPAEDFARAVMSQAAVRNAAPRFAKAARVFASVAGLLAAAAAALLYWADTPTSPAIRLKGGVALQAVAKHGDKLRVIRDGDSLFAGDQLAFAYGLDHPRHLLLLGVDDGATITRYFPAADSRAAPLPATHRAQLPIGIELDARSGEERLYALFSDAVLDEAAARRALLRALAAAQAKRGGIATMAEIDLPAQQVSVWFRKP
jgi:hypothetical protein